MSKILRCVSFSLSILFAFSEICFFFFLQAELLDPAVKGTINVLSTCLKTPSVKRVVLTSSIAAVAFNGMPRTPDTIVDESWFADPEYCRAAKVNKRNNLVLRDHQVITLFFFG